jgi:hypothetical protein
MVVQAEGYVSDVPYVRVFIGEQAFIEWTTIVGGYTGEERDDAPNPLIVRPISAFASRHRASERARCRRAGLVGGPPLTMTRGL